MIGLKNYLRTLICLGPVTQIKYIQGFSGIRYRLYCKFVCSRFRVSFSCVPHISVAGAQIFRLGVIDLMSVEIVIDQSGAIKQVPHIFTAIFYRPLKDFLLSASTLTAFYVRFC